MSLGTNATLLPDEVIQLDMVKVERFRPKQRAESELAIGSTSTIMGTGTTKMIVSTTMELVNAAVLKSEEMVFVFLSFKIFHFRHLNGQFLPPLKFEGIAHC